MWGRKALQKLVEGSAGRLAGNISKDDFLRQLKEAWRPHVKKHTPIEVELASAMARINASGGFKKAFDKVGVTEKDVRAILEEIRTDKVDPIKYEQAKVGRNDPCPCGSGKKFKKCCGKF